LQERSKAIWIALWSITLLFTALYLWFTLFPGAVKPEAIQLFGLEEVRQGRAYSKGIRLSYILNFILQIILLTVLLLTRLGDRLALACERWAKGRRWLIYLAFYFLIWVLLAFASLPFTFFSGFYWQKLWGFSTQSLGSWWVDYGKQGLLDLALGAIGVSLLFQAFRLWPRIWWLICAVLFSLWLILQSLLWPVIVAPMFNKFEPIVDTQLTTMIDELAEKAGLPIDKMLVMDASTKTTKANAYFTGVGETKRIVLYDNLIRQYSLAEIKAVIAHEMAHWQKGHILRGLLLGSLGSFLVWGGAHLLLRREILRSRIKPLVWVTLLLYITLINFVSLPLQNAVSRQMEIEADQTAVILTEDPESAVKLQMGLALKNRSDLSPPAFIEWFSYTHPSVLNRIEKILEVSKQ